MNDEIREILDSVKLEVNSTKSWIEPVGLNRDAWNKLLDYITNLQQERDSYKSRCEKAIEYIQNNMQYDDNIDDNWVMTNDLLNILQNGSEEK